LVSFATGALLGAALIALIPHAMAGGDERHIHAVGFALLIGIGVFFILEKFLLWRHCHIEDCAEHEPRARPRQVATGPLVLIGDALHNALDGVLIAAAFLTDPHLGWVATLAVLAHEIPQEVGNFAVLLHAGMSRARALVWNLLVSLTSVLGGVAGYVALNPVLDMLPFALAFAAASMLYVAIADLIPGLHRRVDLPGSLAQVALIAAGVVAVLIAETHAH
ncbi:MAG: ZIP family metal transporter, partial [Gammaproteobacteria bacterium]|nr:ZIP family metal transporter [Gammaproteobacteria bacterium]